MLRMSIDKDPMVYNAAHIAKSMIYQYKDYLSTSMIFAGRDAPGVFKLYQLPLGGSILEGNTFLGGSGSSYIQGYFDSQYNPQMSKGEALKLAKDCIFLAAKFDSSSGGLCRIHIFDDERRQILCFDNDDNILEDM
eukprot:TRINITY_DN2624_c0_g1_i1.p1 TRINITY_DN2624_c0_g1~~TRINITY_DN2624_c0_g1_i1.p1  ORF type:complete len:136 (-),score=45.06 TRINITY_DN2624_c0_g1_i1:5-412(-)